jgi:hypothetical protein
MDCAVAAQHIVAALHWPRTQLHSCAPYVLGGADTAHTTTSRAVARLRRETPRDKAEDKRAFDAAVEVRPTALLYD